MKISLFFPENTNKIRKESLPKEGENSSSIDSIADNSLTDVVSNSKDELQMDRRVSISFYYHNNGFPSYNFPFRIHTGTVGGGGRRWRG